MVIVGVASSRVRVGPSRLHNLPLHLPDLQRHTLIVIQHLAGRTGWTLSLFAEQKPPCKPYLDSGAGEFVTTDVHRRALDARRAREVESAQGCAEAQARVAGGRGGGEAVVAVGKIWRAVAGAAVEAGGGGEGGEGGVVAAFPVPGRGDGRVEKVAVGDGADL